MSQARAIPGKGEHLGDELGHLSLSASPQDAFRSSAVSDSLGTSLTGTSGFDARRFSSNRVRQLKPFNTSDIKILLLENVNKVGIELLEKQGYSVKTLKSSLPEEELIRQVQDVHIIGIRSKTRLTARVLSSARNLIAIGAFCIGVDQIDLEKAASLGIAVFNSPYANSRSVAELIIAEVIALSRQLGDRNNELHARTWNKVSAGCWEVRGRTIGIVGYGHVGSQVSVLAEAMGMKVLFTDVVNLMNLGSAQQVSLETLLKESDFVTMHVPDLPETRGMIGEKELNLMKKGSYLLNLSRGRVLDIPACVNAMRSGHLAGLAVDVFEKEPAANGEYFTNDLNPWVEDLIGLKNVILTPHIGGSTEEAQRAIGEEVASALIRYTNSGMTTGSVNLPAISLRNPTEEEHHARICFVHKNVAGVLRRVNEILGAYNIPKQVSDSKGDVAYMMADVSDINESEIRGLYENLEGLSARIMTRILY